MSICPLIGYTPPVLKKNYSIGEFIEYTVYNPISNKLERQRIKLTRLSTHFNNKTQYRQQVAVMINSLNAKLASGWTPFGETQTVAEFTPLREAIERYLRDKGRDLRKASMVSYKSVADILLDWLTSKDMDQMASHLFNHRLAISFMDHLIERPKFNNNTYNTYLKKYRACFAWMVEHGYSKENPFEKIKTRQKQEKIRTLIPVEYRDIVINHVRTSEHPNYELVMHLVFTSLIRPSEIERLQVRDVDLMKKCIHIPGSKAKTHKDRDAVLSDACIAMLIPLLAKPGVKPDWYLIDSNYECGEKPCYHGMFKKHWMKIRTDCKLPKEMQLYSLKDSGITEMLDAGVSVNAVKEAAGHADISTTNKYVGKDTEKMIAAVRGANVGLGTNKSVAVEG